MDCQHDWNTDSAIRLVIETGHEVFASVIPMAPKLYRIHYCRECGALRMPADHLAALRQAENKEKEKTSQLR